SAMNSKPNVLLLRAVAKQPPLYDRTDENYRKRLPSENSWDVVASVVGESVEKCKRRWRQLRNDYTRWVNSDNHRRRTGQRRLPYPLANELRFLDRHLNLADDMAGDDVRSESDRERDSESRDHLPLKKVIAFSRQQAPNPAMGNREKSLLKKRSPVMEPEEITDQDQDQDHIPNADKEEGAGEELMDDELTGEFGFDQEASPLAQDISVEGSVDGDKAEFFVKQRTESNSLIIGKKNRSVASMLGSEDEDARPRDPLDDDSGSADESVSGRRAMPDSPSLRPRRVVRASISGGGIKELPIKKPDPGQRLTRLQRRKSLSMAAMHSARSSTSPVKLTPVPRSILTRKSPQLIVKAVSSRDDIFPRPSPSTTGGMVFPKTDSLLSVQRAPLKRGRPPKFPLPVIHRVVNAHPRPQSPQSPVVSTPGSPASTSKSSITSHSAQKAFEEHSPSTSSTPTNTTGTTSSSSTAGTTNVTSTPITITAGSSGCSVATFGTLLKSCERGNQTEFPDINSDDHFLEMIRPQMREMNPRQKLMFKKKVFQSLMETFDDATDFPSAGELQHFNINTPSGFEQVSEPELRLVRELVSMVSAAKVTPRVQPCAAESVPRAPAAASVPDLLRGPQVRVGNRHVIQRVYKPGGIEVTTNNMNGPGHEKKLYRILQMSGKPIGDVLASPEDQRKDSVDSQGQGQVQGGHPKVINPPPSISPRGAAALPAVRPTGSTMNAFFGQPIAVQPAKSGPSLKVRAMSRRYSVCGSGNPANGPPPSQAPANATSLNSNLNPFDAAVLKRRLTSQIQGVGSSPQRPRYSAGTAGQMSASAIPQGASLLVRRSVGPPPVNQKQPSPTGGSSGQQKTPQIGSVQGSAFNDFVQPKASAAPSAVSSSPGLVNGGPSSPGTALKRSLVVANTKNFVQGEKQSNAKPPRSQKEVTETAATIAADDFSLASLKREPVDPMDDQEDLLGI
ncbi:hypothetical protein KR009_001219, partial [Drosophila setifemur]